MTHTQLIFVFLVVEFLYKGWMTWFQMWSVFSLCGLLYIRAWPFQTCPFTRYICSLRVRPSGVWTFLQWVWNLQECSLLLQQSFLPWLLRNKAGELGREMQKIAIEHRKHILCIQTPPLHKPQKNEKTELKISHTYGYQNKCDYVNVHTHIHTIICSMFRWVLYITTCYSIKSSEIIYHQNKIWCLKYYLWKNRMFFSGEGRNLHIRVKQV